MKVGVNCSYVVSSFDALKLPEGKTWDDVEEWWVKWGTFHYKLKDNETVDILETTSPDISTVDFKRPTSIIIEELDEDEQIMGNVLAEY
jgi:hypothetical protein